MSDPTQAPFHFGAVALSTLRSKRVQKMACRGASRVDQNRITGRSLPSRGVPSVAGETEIET
ncbi:hypothetical protein [Spirosoma radiotolerans]|uniref:hypothetical protein n=1 Tax=Spirosoma radiotolerans TaxID=1379870 RepID=UPI0011DDDCC6|nr:hypothetical protein [Spirosoma radiotolerans]